MRVWTTLTGRDEVKVHASRKAAVAELVAFVNACGPARPATEDDWRQVLDDLNGRAGPGRAAYVASIGEHDLGTPRLVVEMGLGAVNAIHTDSPLLDGLEAAVVDSGYDDGVEGDEVMEIVVGGGEPCEFTGGMTSVREAKGWDVGSVYEAIEAMEAKGDPPRMGG